MIWQNPWAWAGLAFLALPVLVHLLSRAPADVRQFPSLRFVEASRLPPKRRTRVRDVPLLLVRLGILAAAVAALAQPLLQTKSRGAVASRTVRAIVVDTSASMQRALATGSGTLADSAARAATASAANAAQSVVLPTANVSEAIAGAATWLKQRQGTHELVVVSDFQRGTIDSLALSAVPARFGVRLIRVEGKPIDSSFTLQRAGGTQLRVTPLVDRTRLALEATAMNDSTPAASRERMVLLGSANERGDALAAMRASAGALRSEPSLENRYFTDLASVASARRADNTREVRLVFPGFPERNALRARAMLPREPWMSEVVLALEASSLLRDVARDAQVGTGQSPAISNDSAPSRDDSTRIVLARSVSGQALVSAAQDTADSESLLL